MFEYECQVDYARIKVVVRATYNSAVWWDYEYVLWYDAIDQDWLMKVIKLVENRLQKRMEQP
jgi:hypothetical protein